MVLIQSVSMSSGMDPSRSSALADRALRPSITSGRRHIDTRVAATGIAKDGPVTGLDAFEVVEALHYASTKLGAGGSQRTILEDSWSVAQVRSR